MHADLLNTPTYNEWRVNAFCESMGIALSEMDYDSPSWNAFLAGMSAAGRQPASEVAGIAAGPCVWATISRETGQVAGASINQAYLVDLYGTGDGFDIVEMRQALVSVSPQVA